MVQLHRHVIGQGQKIPVACAFSFVDSAENDDSPSTRATSLEGAIQLQSSFLRSVTIGSLLASPELKTVHYTVRSECTRRSRSP